MKQYARKQKYTATELDDITVCFLLYSVLFLSRIREEMPALSHKQQERNQRSKNRDTTALRNTTCRAQTVGRVRLAIRLPTIIDRVIVQKKVGAKDRGLPDVAQVTTGSNNTTACRA